MELLHELVLTAFVAVLFSYLVAKLLSFSMAPSAADSSSSADLKDVDEALIVEELQYRENLNVGLLQTESRVELVEESLEKVEKFPEEVQRVEEITDVELVSREEEIETERCKLFDESPEVVEVELCRDSSEEEKTEEGSGEETLEKQQVGETEGGSDMKSDGIVVESEEIGESKDELLIDEDEEWEGIERSELEKTFGAAAKLVESGDKNDLLTDVQMDLYGFHKVATEGPCREPQPMALMVSARAKWNAWQRLGNMSPEAAMKQYVALLSDRVPGWMEENCSGDGKLEYQEAGQPDAGAPDLSSSLVHQTNYTHERNPELKLQTEAGDLTGGLNLETGAKE